MACDGGTCNCKKYVSMNGKAGSVSKSIYQDEIDGAINPVKEKWLNKFKEYEGEK
jgi:hypothetical protein